jgi:hypothetical protein
MPELLTHPTILQALLSLRDRFGEAITVVDAYQAIPIPTPTPVQK